MTMGSHQSTRNETDAWLTPPEIIHALGSFDLDPCCPETMPWRTAREMLSKRDDGLSSGWEGRVFLNPPYSTEARTWLKKLAKHDNGIALIFARTETAWFHDTVWRKAEAILFLKGRIHFHHPDGTKAKANAGAPSCLIAYGRENAHSLQKCGLEGAFVTGWWNR